MKRESPDSGIPMDFRTKVIVRCRCGGVVHVGYSTIGILDVPCLLHTMPFCRDFERLDFFDFLKWLGKPQAMA